MDESIALVEFSKHGERVWSKSFDYDHIEVGLKFLESTQVDGATDAATYLEALRGGARPAFRRTPGAVRDLVAAMWALDPRDRPSARDLGAALDAVRVSSPFGCVSRAPASGR